MPTPRPLRRRLEPALVTEIVEKYQSGATIPALCIEYLVSKGALLKLLRDEGVRLRRQPLSDKQLHVASLPYEAGESLSAIAAHFSLSPGGVRGALLRAGTELRPRGGTRKTTRRT